MVSLVALASNLLLLLIILMLIILISVILIIVIVIEMSHLMVSLVAAGNLLFSTRHLSLLSLNQVGPLLLGNKLLIGF